MGVLLALSRHEGREHVARGTGWRGHLQDSCEVEENRATHASGVHAEHGSAAHWSKDFRTPETGKNYLDYGVFNTGPCPLPGGKVVFTSNRNAFRPPKRLPHTLQLFVMDDDGRNVECIGHLNLGMALHPVVLADGRVMFSSLESQGLRTSTLWGLWSINPDGTNWGPLASAFLPGYSPSRVALPDAVERRFDRGGGVLQPDVERIGQPGQVPGGCAVG